MRLVPRKIGSKQSHLEEIPICKFAEKDSVSHQYN